MAMITIVDKIDNKVLSKGFKYFKIKNKIL